MTDERHGYHDVVGWIRDTIDDGYLRPGDKLPPERLLADVWGVSRPTISRAMVELRHLGLIESRHGNGHFIRANTPADISPKTDYL